MKPALVLRAAPSNPRHQALRSLRSIYAAARRHMTRTRRVTGLNATLVWALDEIGRQPGMRVGDLAARLRVHPSTASNLCRQMRVAGLIASKTPGEDRRAMCLFPTVRGRTLLRRAPRPHRGILVEGLAGLTKEECRQLLIAVTPLRRQLVSLLADEDELQPLAGD